MNGLLQSQVSGSAREAGGQQFWQQLAIRLALWFLEVLSVSYAHICNWKAVLVEGFASLLPSATSLLSTATVCQLLDKKAGRGHKLGWL